MTELIFCVDDPEGRIVRLTRECWDNHITVMHPAMVGQSDKVEETVSDPDVIYRSKRNRESVLYFKRYSALPAGNQHLLVVADSRRGYVQTSFPVRDLKKGGALLWTRG